MCWITTAFRKASWFLQWKSSTIPFHYPRHLGDHITLFAPAPAQHFVRGNSCWYFELRWVRNLEGKSVFSWNVVQGKCEICPKDFWNKQSSRNRKFLICVKLRNIYSYLTGQPNLADCFLHNLIWKLCNLQLPPIPSREFPTQYNGPVWIFSGQWFSKYLEFQEQVKLGISESTSPLWDENQLFFNSNLDLNST